ncbi:MAG: hypothetical protein WBA43_04190 [Elainellaceae cyanobacterium]
MQTKRLRDDRQEISAVRYSSSIETGVPRSHYEMYLLSHPYHHCSPCMGLTLLRYWAWAARVCGVGAIAHSA